MTANDLIFNFIEKNIHLVTVNVDKFCRKVKTGGANLEVTTVLFIPVAVETLGSWGQEALKFIKEVGSRIAQLTGEKKSTYYLFQSLEMANQRGN